MKLQTPVLTITPLHSTSKHHNLFLFTPQIVTISEK